MARRRLPRRQVHLDFHTSPLIHDLLSEWDADAFAETMLRAHVDSVTVFAKCHHGLSYYPTELGQPHPFLQGRDLLGEMIERLHVRGIRAPIYYSVGWEERLARLHPEWCQLKRDGTFARKEAAQGAVDPDKWWYLNFLHPEYLAWMSAEVEELCASYPVDGLFFDIVQFHPDGDFSDHGRRFRAEHGLVAHTGANQARLATLGKEAFARHMSPLIWARHPDARPFYNSAHVLSVDASLGLRQIHRWQRHWEIESLPSGFWGYYHFPRMGRHVSTLGRSWLGMTGRFQRMWGDFGGFKPLAALEYECFRTQALGGCNSIGDQLPPRGRLEPAAYRLIEHVYQQVAQAEPFYQGSESAFDVGVLLASHHTVPSQHATLAEEGAVLMLEEAHYDPALLDDRSDLVPFELVVLPDATRITDRLYRTLRAHYADGGSLLLSHDAGCGVDGRWRLDFLPLDIHGDEAVAPTYWRVREAFFPALSDSDRVFYERGKRVAGSAADTHVLVDRALPYFERSDEHFMSHFQAPPVREHHTFPAVIAGERFVYFADPVFAGYRRHGSSAHRDVVERAIHRLVGAPLAGAGLPRTVTRFARRRGDDLIITLLHYVPQRKALEGDVLEERGSFAGMRLALSGLREGAVVRAFGGAVLARDAAGWLLPASQGRLLLEVPGYFAAGATPGTNLLGTSRAACQARLDEEARS